MTLYKTSLKYFLLINCNQLFPKAVNFTEVNEENKNDLFREVFSSIETLAFTFGNM